MPLNYNTPVPPATPPTGPSTMPVPPTSGPSTMPVGAPGQTPGNWQYGNPGNPAGILPMWNEFMYQGPANYLPFDPIAGFNPTQQNAWGTGMNAANALGSYTQGLMDRFSSYLSSPSSFTPSMNWFDNPHMDQAVESAMQQTTTAFNRDILPQINSSFSSQPGSLRQGLAQGIAAGDLSNNLANMANQMYSSMYETGKQSYLADQANQLGARTAAFSQLPGTLGAISSSIMQPYQIEAGIGQQQQDMSQRKLDEAANRWWFEQYKNRDHLADAIGMLSGTGAGSYTSGESTSTTPGKF